MSIPNYSVLKGIPLAGKIISGKGPHDEPHYHVHLKANGRDYDIAINVESTDGSEVLYVVKNGFTPPDVQALQALSAGTTPLDANSGIALDYVRVPGLVSRSEMSLLPVDQTNPSPSALHSLIDAIIQKAIADNATLYAFGQSFSSGSGSRNSFWGFNPDEGEHDIHFNQGNPTGPHGGSNGTFQDGGIFIAFSDGTWSAIFIAFQSQSWQTDDNGNPV